jgi:hypothetical protein
MFVEVKIRRPGDPILVSWRHDRATGRIEPLKWAGSLGAVVDNLGILERK